MPKQQFLLLSLLLTLACVGAQYVSMVSFGTPTGAPVASPTASPTDVAIISFSFFVIPTTSPTVAPSILPTEVPSAVPTSTPTFFPTSDPTFSPSTVPTATPSLTPSFVPTSDPTFFPTAVPSTTPTLIPSALPTTGATPLPTVAPTARPTVQPTSTPTVSPTAEPSAQPTSIPTSIPTAEPSAVPTSEPSAVPTAEPSAVPTSEPTAVPTSEPTAVPSSEPTAVPSVVPSASPSAVPTSEPSAVPSAVPTPAPTAEPTSVPSALPTSVPTYVPSAIPSSEPTATPSSDPSTAPSAVPSTEPTSIPSASPSAAPSAVPTVVPTSIPTATPTFVPSGVPTAVPTDVPTATPSAMPTMPPTSEPSSVPTVEPTSVPSSEPTVEPTASPSFQPTAPTASPSFAPTQEPSKFPTRVPTTLSPTRAAPRAAPSRAPTPVKDSPTMTPTRIPTMTPSRVPSAAPTGDLKAQFVQAFDATVTTVSLTAAAVYGDVWFSGARVKPSSSGTVAWSNFLQTAFVIPLSTSVISSMSVTRVSELFGSQEQVTCSDAAFSSALVKQYLLSSSSESFSGECNSRQWKVATCAGLPTVCVDCENPCEASCSAIPATSCPGNAYSVLGVEFKTTPPPVLNYVGSSATNSSATIHLSSDQAGNCYCGVYHSGQSPASLEAIQAQGISAAISGGAAVIALTKLSPLFSFDIYCFSEGLLSNRMTFAQMLGPIPLETACCKTLSLSSSIKSIGIGKSSFQAIRLSINYPPSDSVLLSLSLVDDLGATYPVSPSTVEFTRSSVSLQSLHTIVEASTASAGNRKLVVSVTGASTNEFSVTSSPAVSVILDGVSPDAPTVSSVQFSDNGASLLIKLDSPSNKGGSLLGNTFACRNIFSIGSATSSSDCSWTSSSSITLTLGPSATVVPGDQLRFFGQSKFPITADCSPAVAVCNTMQAQNITISAPSNPVNPAVNVVVPSFLSSSSCAKFIVDVSGSTGSGGRQWTAFKVTASTSTGNATLLNNILSSYSLDRPAQISVSSLPPGAYTFFVTLKNFLNITGRSSATVVVVDFTVPFSGIFGLPARETVRGNALRLSYDAYVSRCESSVVSRSNLDISWAVSKNGLTDTSVVNSLPNAAGSYVVSPFSLAVGATYKFSLTVKYLLSSGPPQTSSVTVTVVPAEIVARISGGDVQGVRLLESVLVDAALSYDKDQDNLFGIATGLNFDFSCSTVSPVYSPDCSLVREAATQADKASFLAPVTASGTSVFVSVTVSDSARSSTASITVVAIAANAPVVKLSSSAGGAANLINSDQALVLTAAVEYQSAGSVTWTVDDPQVDLVALTGSSTTRQLSYNKVGQEAASSNVVLSLPPNSLSAGSSLTFRVAVTLNTAASSYSTVSVAINVPPQPGFLVIDPASGTAMSTVFQFIASSWSSESLPLSYSFGFLSDGNFLRLAAFSTSSSTSSVLPPGDDSNGNRITVSVSVLDSLNGANSLSNEVVSILSANADDLAEQLQSFLDSGDVEKAISAGGASLNHVTCSGAPSCSTLNRKGCKKTANTCGSCLGNYIGDVGDHNSLCVRKTAQSLANPSVSCSNSSECDSWKSCVEGSCQLLSKTCPDDCSGNGNCVYLDSSVSGRSVSSCFNGDTSCIASCECTNGYKGKTCSYTAEAFAATQSSRLSLLAAVVDLTDTQEVTAPNVLSWLNSLTVAAANVDELSEEGVQAVYQVLGRVLTQAEGLGIYYSQLDSILALVNSAASSSSSAVPSGGGSSSSSRKLATFQSDQATSITAVLQQFANLVFSAMVDGQAAQTYSYSMYSASFSSVTSSSGALSLSTPVSPVDAVNGVLPQEIAITLPTSDEVTDKVAVVSWRALSFQSSLSAAVSNFLSNPVSVMFNNASVCATGAGCQVQTSFDNFQMMLYNHSRTHSVPTSCSKRKKETFTVECPYDITLTVTCDGSFTGDLISTCPYLATVPQCSTVDLAGALGGGWNVQEYDNYTTTCQQTAPLSSFDGLVGSSVRSLTVFPRWVEVFVNSSAVKIDRTPSFNYRLVLFVFFLTLGVTVVTCALFWRHRLIAMCSGRKSDLNVFDGSHIEIVQHGKPASSRPVSGSRDLDDEQAAGVDTAQIVLRDNSARV